MIKEGILEHQEGRRYNIKSRNIATQNKLSFHYEFYKSYLMIEIKSVIPPDTQDNDI